MTMRRRARRAAVGFTVVTIAAGLALSMPVITSAGEPQVGTPGDDRLVGTGGRDVIEGRGGDDQLLGRGGPDTLIGGGGADVLRAGPSGPRPRDFDEIAPERGRDLVRGGLGVDVTSDDDRDRDVISLGRGEDYLSASGPGSDRYVLGGGADEVFLWPNHGRDEIVCGPGRDRVLVDRPARHDHAHDFVGCERVVSSTS